MKRLLFLALTITSLSAFAQKPQNALNPADNTDSVNVVNTATGSIRYTLAGDDTKSIGVHVNSYRKSGTGQKIYIRVGNTLVSRGNVALVAIDSVAIPSGTGLKSFLFKYKTDDFPWNIIEVYVANGTTSNTVTRATIREKR